MVFQNDNKMPNLGIREISLTDRGIIIGKLQSGMKQRDIAIQHGINQSTVSKIKHKFIRTGDIKNMPRSGRPKVTTVQEDRYMSNLASRQRRLTGKVQHFIMNFQTYNSV